MELNFKVLVLFPMCRYSGNVIVIPRGFCSSSDSGQASCRDVDDMEPGNIDFYVRKHRLFKGLYTS